MIEKLPPRERELFETLYRLRQATAAELQVAFKGAPSNSALRVMLKRLERKGFVTHREEAGRFVYAPALPESRIQQSAARRFIETYFGGSAASAATALLGMSKGIEDSELDRLARLVAAARSAKGLPND